MTPIDVELSKVLATLEWSEDDEARAQARIRDANVAKVEAWANSVTDGLPSWKWARASNPEWMAKVDGRIVEAAKAWKWVLPGDRDSIVAGKGLVLLAPTGAGKSSAIVARIHDGLARLRSWGNRETVGRLPSVLWVREADLVADQWAGGELGPRAKRADVLIIDELGFANGEKAPTGKSPVIMDIVFRRYDDGRSTTITSGLASDQLAERYGTSMFRRLAEGATIVDLMRG